MLTKNRLASSALVLAGGLFAAGAFANPQEGYDHKGGEKTYSHSRTGDHSKTGQDISFEQLDEDRDGYISNAEFQTTDASEQVDHDALDTDNDGRLNRTEFAAFEQMSQDTSSDQRMQTDPSWQRDQTHPTPSSEEPFQASDPTRDPGSSDE